jgi:hypothetical protein
MGRRALFLQLVGKDATSETSVLLLCAPPIKPETDNGADPESHLPQLRWRSASVERFVMS